jgi:DNA mismatch repair protein MutL
MAIRVLAPEVVSQIAAGEVVERPSSAVKELLENAIDAGATDVRIELRHGGKQSISVTDDGCGIPAADVELAFARHATSKLSAADDLEHITTLGFRGEALASIAAVSRVTMVSRAVDEPTGTLIRLEGGVVVERRPSGRPPGTAITVEDLFFNVPARRKFLRSDGTERRHIDAWVTRYAIARPGLRLTLVHDQREVFHSPGNGRLRDALLAVYGSQVAGELLEVLPDASSAHPSDVTGFVGPPTLHRANRQAIAVFVNGRWVQNAGLTYAVVQAYHTLLPRGRYPIAVVMVDLPPEEVDVNVHPTKVEVRFRDPDAVFRAVQRAVRRVAAAGVPLSSLSGAAGSVWPGTARPAERPPAATPQTAPLPIQALPAVPGESGGTLPPLRVVGQIGGTYVVAEGPDGLYLVDQHAAHERVLYEQMMPQQRALAVAGQRLLDPVIVEVSPQDAALLEEHLELLRRLGFDVDGFGGNAFVVRALPAVLARARADEALHEVAAALSDAGMPVEGEMEQAVVRAICKRAAVKAGQVLTREEMEGLLRSLERCASPRTCPHGRPTMIRLTVEQLAREFGRH